MYQELAPSIKENLGSDNHYLSKQKNTFPYQGKLLDLPWIKNLLFTQKKRCRRQRFFCDLEIII